MSTQRRDLASLQDMGDYAQRVVDFSRSLGANDLKPKSTNRAVLERWIEVIGEAANRISKEFQNLHPEIPWAKIKTTRNILAHGYDIVDHDVLTRIASVHLPELILQIKAILPPDPANPEPEP